MIPHSTRPSTPTAAEACAWAEVLVGRRLLHAAVLAPTGQWPIQHEPDGLVSALPGPAEVVELVAAVQHRIRRSARPRTR